MSDRIWEVLMRRDVDDLAQELIDIDPSITKVTVRVYQGKESDVLSWKAVDNEVEEP